MEDRIFEILKKNISMDEIEKSIIIWNKSVLKKGALIRIGKKNIEMPFDGYLLFIDLEPKANWGHYVLYILINSSNQESKTLKEQFPPFFEEYPSEFRVLLRYGEKPTDDRYFNAY